MRLKFEMTAGELKHWLLDAKGDLRKAFTIGPVGGICSIAIPRARIPPDKYKAFVVVAHKDPNSAA